MSHLIIAIKIRLRVSCKDRSLDLKAMGVMDSILGLGFVFYVK